MASPSHTSPPPDPRFVAWARGALSRCTGFPDAEIDGSLLPLLVAIPTRDELAATLAGLLGAENAAVCAEFVERRFAVASAEPPNVWSKQALAPPPVQQESSPARQRRDLQAEEPSRKPSPSLKDKKNRSTDPPPNREAEQQPARACGCAATVHRLAGNCTRCGRIACVVEGNYCFTCNAPRTCAEASNQAVEHRDRLLEYDATAAQRTRVIDVRADYVDPRSAKWMSDKERADQAKIRQQRMDALTNRPTKVLDLTTDGKLHERNVVTVCAPELDLRDQDLENEWIPASSTTSLPTRDLAENSNHDDDSDKEDSMPRTQPGSATGLYEHKGLIHRPIYVPPDEKDDPNDASHHVYDEADLPATKSLPPGASYKNQPLGQSQISGRRQKKKQQGSNNSSALDS